MVTPSGVSPGVTPGSPAGAFSPRCDGSPGRGTHGRAACGSRRPTSRTCLHSAEADVRPPRRRPFLTLRGHRGDVDDLIWEADKYPSSRQVRYDFSAMPLAGGIVVEQTIARDECVRFTRACRDASAT